MKTPYDLRDEAMKDVLKAYDSNNAKGGKYTIKFKMKKATTDSIVIQAKYYKIGRPYTNYWTKEPLQGAEEIPNDLVYDTRLQKTRLGEFYLCLLKPLDIRPDSQRPNKDSDMKKIISLDPGIRTFCTGYDPDGLVVEWGKGDIGRIHRLCVAVDRLQSKWSQKEVRHNKRYKYKELLEGLERKFEIR